MPEALRNATGTCENAQRTGLGALGWQLQSLKSAAKEEVLLHI